MIVLMKMLPVAVLLLLFSPYFANATFAQTVTDDPVEACQATCVKDGWGYRACMQACLQTHPQCTDDTSQCEYYLCRHQWPPEGCH